MNGLPYTVTSVTRHLDAAVEAAVDKAQREQAAATKAQRKEASIRSRLHKLDANLRDIQDVYDKAHHTWANAGSPLQSPNYGLRRAGKPESRTPSEAEGQTRVYLVLAAQRLAMALRILARHDWLASKAWHPYSVQQTIDGAYAWTGSGEPMWRDPDGDVTVEPPDVTLGVSQLRGAVAALKRIDWDNLADQDAVRDFLHEAEQAVYFVNKTGAWFRGMPPQEVRVCSRQGCWKESPDGLVCGACRQKDWRGRQKAS